MDFKIKNWVALSLIPQVILVKWMANYPDAIEKYYSEGIYPWISKFFRILYGWIPFSIGDVFYFILSVLAIWYVIKQWSEIRTYPLRFLRDVLFVLSIVYFTFHLLWGMNYYRQPLAQKFAFNEKHSDHDIIGLVEVLILKTNELQFRITQDTALAVNIPYSKNEIFNKTLIGYENLKKDYPF
ncbi:MAG: DUF3810 domain-containing protein, partial [Maribacter sp.]|nr:DUF3810 domain-containing protein [Maribacter sp.]